VELTPRDIVSAIASDIYAATELGIWVIDRGSIGFMGQPE
jgi:hypothetical protein